MVTTPATSMITARSWMKLMACMAWYSFLDARANRSSAKANLSEQQIHNVFNAGTPMLHGRAQVNIAPCRRKPMQYVETDRPLRHCRWPYPRDDVASADVP